MAPVSVRKEIGLPAPVRVALGTLSLQRRVPGGWAELGRRTPAWDLEGMSGSLEGDLGSRPSHVPLCHSWELDLEEALALGMSMSGPSNLLCCI